MHALKQLTHISKWRSRGLTGIELMVTVAILAILLGLAAPSMSRFVQQWRVSNTLNALTGSLRLARTEAIARARIVVICSVSSSTSTDCKTSEDDDYASGWIVFVNNDGDSSLTFLSSNGDELLIRQEAPAGIADITLSSAGKFVFYPNGLAQSANGINVSAVGYASSKPWTRKAICISKPGRIRYVADNSDCT